MIIESLIGPVLGIFGGAVNRWLGIKETRANMELEQLKGKNRLDELAQLASMDAMKARFALDQLTATTDGQVAVESQKAGQVAGQPSLWVLNVIHTTRPALTALSLAAAVVLTLWKSGVLDASTVEMLLLSSWYLASTAFGWWFGDRSAARNISNRTPASASVK